MARLSDVQTSSRDTSPDPLTLPSSPLQAHSTRKTRSSVKPSPRKLDRRSATPSKSIVLDTPKAADGTSPWRIKVTVEAEPRDGSPGKRVTRTTSVPLKDSGSHRKRSSSPIKRAMAKKENAPEVKRPARKRKGTPLKETRPARPQPQPEVEPTTEEDDAAPKRSLSPARRASGRLARLSMQPGSARSKRLSYARDELDHALQTAIGQPDFGRLSHEPPGDMTVSKNEDFSMVSVESLQTAKDHSMSNVMQTIPEGDPSTASVSYMASSPPKPQYPDLGAKAQLARSRLGDSVMTPYDEMSWKPTGKAQKPFSSPQVVLESRRHANQSTGPAKISSSDSLRKQREQANAQQWQRERQSVSQRIENANAEDVVVVDDAQEEEDGGDYEPLYEQDVMHDDHEPSDGMDEDEVPQEQEQGQDAMDDEDIWQDEASRSLEEDQGQHRSRREVPKQAEQQERSPQVEDLFADQPLKPLRSKIPRTWRRSSGMDFSYVDSPAHPEPGQEQQVPEEEEVEEQEEPIEDQPQNRRHSTDGSGVLTPPSTDPESEEEEADQEDEEDAESEFAPDAEATRYHNDAAFDDQAERDAAATPDSDDSMSDPDGEDTGNFFQTNLPQVYQPKERPRRRPPRQETMNLTELLNLDGSPAKPAFTGSKAGADGSIKAQQASSSSHIKPSSLRTRPLESGIKLNPSTKGKEKVVDSPLRKSLIRSSRMQTGSSAPDVQREEQVRANLEMRRQERLARRNESHARPLEKQQAVPELQRNPRAEMRRQERQRRDEEHSRSLEMQDAEEAVPARQRESRVTSVQQMGRQPVSRRHDQSHSRSLETQEVEEAGDSLESKTSDQQQLLSEANSQYLEEEEQQQDEEDEEMADDEEMIEDQRPPTNAHHAYARSEEEYEDEYEDEEQPMQDPSRSYEERLNKDSPQKVRMNFNDSKSTTYLLSPRKERLDNSFFDLAPAAPVLQRNQTSFPLSHQPQHHRPSTLNNQRSTTLDSSAITLVAKQAQPQPGQAGILSRLTTTFWNAIVGPPEPAPTDYIKPSLRTQLRSRYGVVSSTHPWTFHQMRILHRMLNSAMKRPGDTLIPNSGPIPPAFQAKIGTWIKSIDNSLEFLFDEQCAYVILAWYQLTVPSALLEAMDRGDVEWLGDGTAKRCRGKLGEHYGWERVFTKEGHGVVVSEWVDRQRGEVGVEFLVRALGSCLESNERGEREKANAEMEG